jgi:environmental stress-induced protein Ves
VKILRAADYEIQAWRNGRGSTREVLSFQSAQFRISLAELREDAEFSMFPGVDRSLFLWRGGPVELAVDGKNHLLHCSEAVNFAGEATCFVTVVQPATDLNIMTQRAYWTSRAKLYRGAIILDSPAKHVVIVACEGEVLVGEAPHRLLPDDACWWDGGLSRPVHIDGRLWIAIELDPV